MHSWQNCTENSHSSVRLDKITFYKIQCLDTCRSLGLPFECQWRQYRFDSGRHQFEYKIWRLQTIAVRYWTFFYVIEGFAWVLQSGARLGYGVRNQFQATYPTECQWKCFMDDYCDSVNYRPADHTCQLITQYSPSAVNFTDIISDPNWEWWSNQFTQIDM